ncbi:hypothetical protein [Streptomyces sp. NPDC094149]|uniref:hypothetical protein n=1 Tax=Streptomyces sp. NPDC094149 TaxID=3155079 RepID=UPI0033322B1B
MVAVAGVSRDDGGRARFGRRAPRRRGTQRPPGVWCATNLRLAGLGGAYCENCDISPLVAPEEEAAWRAGAEIPGVLPYAVDPEAAARLWEVSERLTA